MTETSVLQPAPRPSVGVEEALRLACPRCGDGLNLMRRHLGMPGQCVHCRTPLVAREEGGAIRAVADASPPAEPGPAWGFPGLSATSCSPAFAAPLPTRESDNLFTRRPDVPAPAPLPAAKAAPSPFDTPATAPVPSMFASGGESASIATAWGTKVPSETHASISPFGTGSVGGGFAESLFREKVVKESAVTNAGIVFASPFVPAAPAAAPEHDGQVNAILDGDGRPMRAMTKEEEEAFAQNFFKYENARNKSRGAARFLKKIVRLLIVICVLGAVGAGTAFFMPKETLAAWKGKVVDWLEPGMAILDYLPEGLRPDWLPRTQFGIDAGVDEKGQPKRKLNALEGFDKLKGDVGNLRDGAENELERLNDR